MDLKGDIAEELSFLLLFSQILQLTLKRFTQQNG